MLLPVCFTSVVPCLISVDVSFKNTALLLNLCALLLFCDHRFQRGFSPFFFLLYFLLSFCHTKCQLGPTRANWLATLLARQAPAKETRYQETELQRVNLKQHPRSPSTYLLYFGESREG